VAAYLLQAGESYHISAHAASAYLRVSLRSFLAFADATEVLMTHIGHT
jgi:hypothetical protein